MGPSSETTGPWVGGEGASYPQWRSLNYNFSIMKDMRLRTGLFLGSNRIGATFFSFDEIKSACENESRSGTLYGVLVDLDDNIIGKLRLNLLFNVERTQNQSLVFEDQTHEGLVKGSLLDSSITSGELANFGPSRAHRVLEHVNEYEEMTGVEKEIDEGPLKVTKPNISISQTMRSSISTKKDPIAELPVRVFLSSVSCSELRPVHTFSMNSPALQISCGGNV